jgi:hypothetical protein
LDTIRQDEFVSLERIWSRILFEFYFELSSCTNDAEKFDSCYRGSFRKLFKQYNSVASEVNTQLAMMAKSFRLQLLMEPELTTLEVVGLRSIYHHYTITIPSLYHHYIVTIPPYIITIRLYSGPMFNRYNNGVCRARKHGVYSTTIWVINSGLIKLARITKATTVWRGVKGKLPDQVS